MSFIDYSTLSVTDRIKTALSQAAAVGIDRAKALSLTALSIPESDAIWTMARATGGPLNSMDSCWPGRVVIGLETRSGTFGRRFDDAWVKNSEGALFLQSNGYGQLKSDGQIYPTIKTNSKELAFLLDWVIGRRFGDLLADFSVGPTQEYLWFTKMSTDSSGGPKNADGTPASPNTGFPATWEDLATFITETDAGALMEQIVYMDPANNPFSKTWPASHPDDDEENMKWLTNHVGPGSSILNTYYNTHFKPALEKVLSTAGVTSA